LEIFYGHLVCFEYFGIFCPVLIFCIMKNLATLVLRIKITADYVLKGCLWLPWWWRRSLRLQPRRLRAILNFTPAPRGEICPLGVKFTPSFTPRGEHSLLFRRMEGQTGDNFTPRGQSHPGGTTSPLGVKVCPLGWS
jgi:hypothetical protein